jgi:hypothetical protein
MVSKRSLRVILVVAVLLPGCLVEGGQIVFYGSECPDNPVLGHLDRNGNLDPCCKDQTIPCTKDGVIPPQQCTGSCLAKGPRPNWLEDPVLLWFGNYSDTPDLCPDGSRGDEVYRDPITPYSCPACECSDPACVLPSGMIASASGGCMGQFTPFPATKPDGCSTPTKIQPNDLQSVSIQPPTVSSCVPSMADIVVPKDLIVAEWAKKGRVCSGVRSGHCDDESQVCVSLLPSAPPGWMQCIQNITKGDQSTLCPDSYPYPITGYQNRDHPSSCSPCECDPPVGSECTAEVSAYTDSSCVEASYIFEYVVPLGPPVCAPIPANMGLQGMTEKWFLNQPGKCMPKGGDPTGKPIPDEKTSWTFCCAQDPGIEE